MPRLGAREQLEVLRDQLYSFKHARSSQSRRSCTGVLLLLIGFLAFSFGIVCSGLFLRGHFGLDGLKGGSSLRFLLKTLRSEAVDLSSLLPVQKHSAQLHAEAQKLKEVAESPELSAVYSALSPEEKRDWLAEQVSERLTAEELLEGDRCPGLRSIYQPLVDDMLAPFKKGFTVEHLKNVKRSPSVTLYIKHGKLYVEGSDSEKRHPMTVLWLEYLYWLLQEVKLPDLVLPVNPDDYPLGAKDPWFSFCRQPRSFTDLLLPNLVEEPIAPGVSSSAVSRAGRDDTRRPMAVWLGRPMAWHRGKRRAIVEEGSKHPEKVYAGLTDWTGLPLPASGSEDEWLKYYKPRMDMRDWADQFKYVINVEGQCGSARLATQLHSDAAVFFVAGEDEEWYYPLLKPFVHYIPVTVNADGSTDLLARIEWAESHPEEVAEIVQTSTAFAETHLAPRKGRDCFTTLLLSGFADLIFNASQIQPPPGLQPYKGQKPR